MAPDYPRWTDVQKYFSPASPLPENATLEQVRKHIRLTQQLTEATTSNRFGARLLRRGLHMQQWALEKPNPQAVKLVRTVHLGTIAGGVLATIAAGHETVTQAQQIPPSVDALSAAELHYDWSKFDTSQLLPSFTHLPDPVAAFKPVQEAHDKGVREALATLQGHITNTITYGVATLAGGIGTLVDVVINPHRPIRQNSSTIVPFAGKAIAGIGRRFS